MMRPRLVVTLLGVVAALAACATPPQPPVPTPAPTPAAVIRPVAPVLPEREVVTAPGWTFDAAACVAHAAGRAFSLTLRGDDDAVQISLSYRKSAWRQRAVPVEYQGRAGRWTATGRVEGGRNLLVTSLLSEESVGRALILLAGGTLMAQQSPGRHLVLRIQSGGKEGQAWFECLKRRLLP